MCAPAAIHPSIYDVVTVLLTVLLLSVSSLYNNEDFFADLSHIIVLRQSSASLMRECNDQFLDEYLHLTDQVLDAVNPYFNLAWQVCYLYHSLYPTTAVHLPMVSLT